MTVEDLVEVGYAFNVTHGHGVTVYVYGPAKNFVGGVTCPFRREALAGAHEKALLHFVESRLDVPNL